MNANSSRIPLPKSVTLLLALALVLAPVMVRAAPPTRPSATPELEGRRVEQVRIIGNTSVSSTVIEKLIRTRVGEPLDSATVEEDYRRIYGELKKFSNVQARVEPTATGVIVTFDVREQKQISAIRFVGNRRVETETLQNAVDIQVGQAIDPFKISLARGAIEALYREKNYPFAHVEVPDEPLGQHGELIFNIVEGPNVRVRNVRFRGARSFSQEKLGDQVKTAPWFFILRPGRYDPEQVDEDVAALRRFYEGKGFFDVRVGRKLVFSPDMTEMQVEFLIAEGPRYTVDSVTFEGNTRVSEQELRGKLKMTEGRTFDEDILKRDVRQVVRAYSPYGFIYQEQSNDPDYLRVDARHVFRTQPGHVQIAYLIHEGKSFRVGRILVKGNYKSQDRLVLREMRFGPGQKFNSGEMQDAMLRLRSTPYFSSVNITPIGEDPEFRDVLVEVTEQKTASFNVGAGVNSNGGIGGNITYEQKNFDLFNVPSEFGDVFTERGFTGAGQNLRLTFEPGTIATNASLRFTEPWLFDQPYSFTNEVYLRNRIRENYEDRRVGDRLTLGKRFDYVYSAAVTFRAEEAKISHIDNPEFRAPEILAERGSHALTSITLQGKRDTVNPGYLPYHGTQTTAAWESFGAMGGEFDFQKFTVGWDGYQTLHEDLIDRKTVLGLHANAGVITGDSVFFERFYGGGISSVRGFRFRGISPRSGRADDPVGGDFALTGSAELNFPVTGESLRGVVFADAGTVETDVRIGTIRTSVGAGIRLVLPFLGQTPLAIDFAVPITKDREDDVQFISFSLGISP